MMRNPLIGGALVAALSIGLIVDVVPSFADPSSSSTKRQPTQVELPSVSPPPIMQTNASTASRPVDVERLGEPPRFSSSASESEP
ncbi:hypothetical protein OFB79_25525, partial [Escherichia coli]|nr:hypothetical protein [Escherichia coli]